MEPIRPGYPPLAPPHVSDLLVGDLAARADKLDRLLGSALADVGDSYAVGRRGEPLTFGQCTVLKELVAYRCVAATPAGTGWLVTVWLGTSLGADGARWPYESALVIGATAGDIDVLGVWANENQALASHRRLAREHHA